LLAFDDEDEDEEDEDEEEEDDEVDEDADLCLFIRDPLNVWPSSNERRRRLNVVPSRVGLVAFSEREGYAVSAITVFLAACCARDR
jgi:hypothetical protein